MARVGLVVGGASGIGAAACEALANAGLAMGVADLKLDRADATAGALGTAHKGYAVNMADEAEVAALFDQVEIDLGPVAVLVIAAGSPGFIDGQRPSLRETTVASWDNTMAVNARGTFLCVREMLKRRDKQRVERGRIILIASMAAQTLAKNGPPSYVASKGAVQAFLRSAANEAAQFGITVNAVAPGAIDTPMLREVMSPDRDDAYFGGSIAGRVGSPNEIAAVIGFLASEAADYINGACIDVNGGLFMR